MEPSVVEIDFGIRIIFLLSSSSVFDLYLLKSGGGKSGGSGGGVRIIFGFGLSGKGENFWWAKSKDYFILFYFFIRVLV